MSTQDERFDRQTFLGERAPDIFSRARVAVIGLGGGGSHIGQQLSHVGIRNLYYFDHDAVTFSNLNRLVGATVADAEREVLKTAVAGRIHSGLHPDGCAKLFPGRWQDHVSALRECDIIVSCVDSFAARRDLEAEARRGLIPLIDIGIDVHPAISGPPRLVGQIILSMPGFPCMQCLGFLSESNLAKEAADYGAAGPRPQVIWPNGIVASFAVDLVVDLLTDWTGEIRGPVYLSYDGNRRTVTPSTRLSAAPLTCVHYPRTQVGAPAFRRL
ncbi:MAG: ThiF family adenylyltransferase [Verrucomicrobiales bacterium]|nr:ThiF family adenylyltransferase [Verrucomicrobiales bacterium]